MITAEILQALFDLSPSGIAIADEAGRYLHVNDAYCSIFGYARAELLGQTFGLILLPEDQAREPEILQLALTEDRAAPSEWRVRHKDGHALFVHSAFKTLIKPDGSAQIITILSDVSTLTNTLRTLQEQEQLLRRSNELLEEMVSRRTAQLERANRELARMATQDPLTGLANRRAFEQEAQRLIGSADRHQRALSVLFLDIDHFKSINDQYGHSAGDLAIQAVARHIQRLLRAEDLIARWGGEEFVVLLPDTPLEQAVAVGEKILSGVRWLSRDCLEVPRALTISGGLVERQRNQSLGEVLQQADQLLYQAKHLGRDRLEYRPLQHELLIHSRIRQEDSDYSISI
ncbi:sensor domain-containing diguanylate cyclase [Chitinibacter tainanensis]|uniref:sensor domain-containing diguanylate cyclase n=1 Tax=Chitinibacter tainanensis TaxID=230667 RepID=UPI0023576B67|nr:sensor domain-containing diguanylate cyclase [Chitinibacter tainanensis]